jgi:hypothetical protein
LASGDGFAKSLKIGVEAAVVVNGKDEVFLFSEFQELDGFGDGGGEGFVDDHVFAGFKATLGQGKMRLVGRGDHYKLDGVESEEFIEGADDARVWIELRGGIAGTLENGGESKAWDSVDDRSVKAACAETETDESNIHHEGDSSGTKMKRSV